MRSDTLCGISASKLSVFRIPAGRNIKYGAGQDDKYFLEIYAQFGRKLGRRLPYDRTRALNSTPGFMRLHICVLR